MINPTRGSGPIVRPFISGTRQIVFIALSVFALHRRRHGCANRTTFKSEVIDPTMITGDIRFYDCRGWRDQNQPYPRRRIDPTMRKVLPLAAISSSRQAARRLNLGFSPFAQHSIIL